MVGFIPADELAKEKGLKITPKIESALTVCKLCGRDAEPVCWDCLDATIETAIERLVDEGKLDAAIERVLAKRWKV